MFAFYNVGMGDAAEADLQERLQQKRTNIEEDLQARLRRRRFQEEQEQAEKERRASTSRGRGGQRGGQGAGTSHEVCYPASREGGLAAMASRPGAGHDGGWPQVPRGTLGTSGGKAQSHVQTGGGYGTHVEKMRERQEEQDRARRGSNAPSPGRRSLQPLRSPAAAPSPSLQPQPQSGPQPQPRRGAGGRGLTSMSAWTREGGLMRATRQPAPLRSCHSQHALGGLSRNSQVSIPCLQQHVPARLCRPAVARHSRRMLPRQGGVAHAAGLGAGDGAADPPAQAAGRQRAVDPPAQAAGDGAADPPAQAAQPPHVAAAGGGGPSAGLGAEAPHAAGASDKEARYGNTKHPQTKAVRHALAEKRAGVLGAFAQLGSVQDASLSALVSAHLNVSLRTLVVASTAVRCALALSCDGSTLAAWRVTTPRVQAGRRGSAAGEELRGAGRAGAQHVRPLARGVERSARGRGAAARHGARTRPRRQLLLRATARRTAAARQGARRARALQEAAATGTRCACMHTACRMPRCSACSSAPRSRCHRCALHMHAHRSLAW